MLGPPDHTNGWYGPIEQRVPEVNRVYQSIVACSPTMGLFDWRVIAAPDGSYADYLPNTAGQPIQVRKSDGFHLTPAGIDLQADLTLPAIDHQRTAGGGRPGPWDGQCNAATAPAGPHPS